LNRTDSVTGGSGWNWSSNASNASVADPDGHTTQYWFDGGGLVSTISNAASTDYLCYNGATLSGGACTSAPSGAITEIRRYTTLADTSQTRLSDVFLTGPRPTEQDEYDWGAGGAPGALLQKTLTTYALYGLPASISSEDGGSNTLAKTSFAYDEYPVDSSGATQLAAPAGARGNLTSVTEWVSPTQSLAKHFTYYDTGQPHTATDVNGAVATYTYGACNQSYPTLVQEPLSSLTVTMGWDCRGGVITSYTDENGNAATTSYGDPGGLWRPTSSADAGGNQTVFSYTNAAGGVPAQTEAVLSFNSGSSVQDQLTSFDGLGRPYLSQTRQGPGDSLFDSVQTLYDAEGRASQVSAPYVAAANAAAPAGENAKKRQVETDGLGRIASVCEVVTDTTSGAMPGSGTCAQQRSLKGYWTIYTYAHTSAGSVTSISQNAQAASSNWEVRALVYDGLDRLVSETMPESGISNFTFDAESNHCGIANAGDMVMKQDAMGNISCYAHDAAHRLTAVTYPSGPYASPATPEKHFVYDAASVGGSAMANIKGELAEAYTGPSSGKITDLGFSLDALGNLADVYESTPHSGGWYHLTAGYWPNGMLRS